MPTVHNGLSIAVSVKPGKEGDVKQLLSQMNQDPGNNEAFPFSQLTTTFFATWTVIPSQDYHGKELPPTCMLLTSYYGSSKEHINEIITHGAKGLREVFQHCKGFPEAAKTSDHALKHFVRKNHQPTTYYTGMQYLTLEDTQKENQLRNALESYLEEEKDTLGGLSALRIRREMQEHVKSQPDLSWAVKPYKLGFANYWGFHGLIISTAVILALLVLLSLVLIFKPNPVSWGAFIVLMGGIVTLGSLLLWLRIWEKKPQYLIERQPDERIREVSSTEKFTITNEMTVSGLLKKGFIHRLFLAVSLRIIRLNKTMSYIPTVSTARWLQIDGGRRMIFIAYYTNTSEGYARDFVDSKARARSLNLIFGHGYGYEPTRWAFFDGGAKNPQAYMDSMHSSQYPTQLWYYNNADLSIDNININHKIRAGLWGEMTEGEAQNWLYLL